MAQIDRDAKAAFAAAVKAGWSPEELKHLGFDTPGPRDAHAHARPAQLARKPLLDQRRRQKLQ